jgi:hypothetical protein
MANAPRDENRIPTALGVLYTDGVTVIPIAINPVTGNVKTVTGLSISQAAKNIAPRDENSVPSLLGVSSVDGVTPIPIYVDETGAILIEN